MPPEGRSVRVGARALGYWEAGRGQPVVLVHGAAGRGAVWSPQLGGLEDAARIVALDLPGHGESAGPGCAQIAEYADWVVRFLDAIGLERVVLGGHSMGGAIAQQLALRLPERVEALILIGTGARLRVLGRVLELFREDAPAGRRLVAGLAYSERTPPGSIGEAERALAETSPLVILGDFLACDRFDLTEEVAAIRAPTLVVVGREDRLTPPKYAAFLARTIPGARLVDVPEAGHFPQLEQAGAVNRALREFLGALS